VPGCLFYGKYCRLHKAIKTTKATEKEQVKQRAPIKKVSAKREQINRHLYRPKVKAFLKQNPVCNIRAPDVCTKIAKCVNHTKGKDSIKDLLDESFWEPSCFACNNWIEANHKWAQERGHKKRKHSKDHKNFKPISNDNTNNP
jgi:hypothetical protein